MKSLHAAIAWSGELQRHGASQGLAGPQQWEQAALQQDTTGCAGT